jgi:hypothetical protein
MGYQIAGIFGGALAPIISIKLVQATGTAFAVSAYVLVALLITLVALGSLRRPRGWICTPTNPTRPICRVGQGGRDRSRTQLYVVPGGPDVPTGGVGWYPRRQDDAGRLLSAARRYAVGTLGCGP